MKVIVGLGNPGREYAGTRHNVGWWVLDHLAEAWRFDGWKRDGAGHVASGSVHGTRVRLVKPQTYMNLSGEVLRPYKRRPFWSAATDLLVVVDEVQLPVGRYRFRAKGSAGGHNGLKSVEAHLQSQEYSRLRIGVGPADEQRKVAVLHDYVLGAFGKSEAEEVQALFPTLVQGIELWLQEGIPPVMNRFPGKKRDGEPC
ncbi:MAG TPA: aminoacyl-tRNA hydrolase [Gemmatimonadaceae bacterium]|nr:aminoacyl-tRNA hydrolase [Gemmatimonadaceae bacterium]